MKNLITICFIIMLGAVSFGASVEITSAPETLKPCGFGEYSPMIEIVWNDLPADNVYRIFIRLYYINQYGSRYYASTQWKSTFGDQLYNHDGSNSDGELRKVKNMDIFNSSNALSYEWSVKIVRPLDGFIVAQDEYSSEKVSNEPPILSNIGTQNYYLGETISFQASATDPEDDPITFSITDLPENATFDSEGNFEWTPTAIGTHTIYVHAETDQNYDSEEIVIQGWQRQCSTYLQGDINKDCRVDILDFAILASNWLQNSID
jgi:hypothetical protein